MTTTTETDDAPMERKAPEEIWIPPIVRGRGGSMAAGDEFGDNDGSSGNRIVWGEFHKSLHVSFPFLYSETASEVEISIRLEEEEE